MKKLLFLCLLAFGLANVNAQEVCIEDAAIEPVEAVKSRETSSALVWDFCADDVVTNLTAEIQKTAMQVYMAWDFDTPITCATCPPYPVYYDIEVEFGQQYFGPLGPITWFSSSAFTHVEPDTETLHEYIIPITFKFEFFRYRVKVQGCSNWDGWVTVSIWD